MEAQRKRAAIPVPPSADLLLTNGNFITMDAKLPSVEAVAITDGRIVWIGTDKEARKRFATATAVQDLHGWTVLPGLIDAHTHLLSLGESMLKLNLKGVATPQEAAARVRERVRGARPGDWILGWGWDEGAWASSYPTHRLLTEAAPANPVVLSGLHSFATWINRAAMVAAGIARDTADPENGKVLRDDAGDPSGVLTDRAQALVTRHIPALGFEQRKKTIEMAALECVRVGLTEAHEARVSAEDIRVFRTLIAENRLLLRVYAMLDGADTALVSDWLRKGPEIDPRHRLTIRSVKVFADGALGSRGAALLQPYADAPDRTGVITTPLDRLEDLTRRCLARGFQVITHAIGDAANRLVLDAYQRAQQSSGKRDSRLRIEHAQVLAPADIPRFAQLGVIASMQPSHATSDMPWAEKRVGPERIRGAYAWRSVLRSGARLPLSSDFPGETWNPFGGMYAAVTRQDEHGNPPGGWYPEQRLTVDEALRGYTVEAAYAGFEEHHKGMIAVGQLADFTVIERDLRALTPKDWLTMKVRMTLVGGRFVYDARRHEP